MLLGLLHRLLTSLGCLSRLIRSLRGLIQIDRGCSQLFGQLVQFILQGIGLLVELALLSLLGRLCGTLIVALLLKSLSQLLLLLSDLLGSICQIRSVSSQCLCCLLSRLSRLLRGVGSLWELPVASVVARLLTLLHRFASGLGSRRVRTSAPSGFDRQFSGFGS